MQEKYLIKIMITIFCRSSPRYHRKARMKPCPLLFSDQENAQQGEPITDNTLARVHIQYNIFRKQLTTIVKEINKHSQ
jgi:hypothetical protein